MLHMREDPHHSSEFPNAIHSIVPFLKKLFFNVGKLLVRPEKPQISTPDPKRSSEQTQELWLFVVFLISFLPEMKMKATEYKEEKIRAVQSNRYALLLEVEQKNIIQGGLMFIHLGPWSAN